MAIYFIKLMVNILKNILSTNSEEMKKYYIMSNLHQLRMNMNTKLKL